MAKFTINSMLSQNGGPVTISSILINKKDLKPETIDAIRNATIVAAVDKASELWGPEQALTIRDLNATDMAYAANEFTENSNAGANAWNAMAFGAFTVPTATVIGIYGLDFSFLPDGTVVVMPITGVRFDVGGSRVAQWHIEILSQSGIAGNTSILTPTGGVTKSPIIVAEDITVTIYEYTKTINTDYAPIWLGVSIEKMGVTLKP